MFYHKPKFNESSMNDEHIIIKGEVVGRNLTGSSRYTNPPVTGTAITAGAAEGRVKKLAAIGGTDVAKNEFADFMIEFRNILRITAAYVNSKAAGNRTAVLESGFDCTEPPKRGTKTPHSAKTSATPGAIDIYYRPFARCGGVSHQVCNDPPTEEGFSPQRMGSVGAYVWTGLITGKKVWTRSCHVVPGGQSAWTDPIPVYVG